MGPEVGVCFPLSGEQEASLAINLGSLPEQPSASNCLLLSHPFTFNKAWHSLAKWNGIGLLYEDGQEMVILCYQ